MLIATLCALAAPAGAHAAAPIEGTWAGYGGEIRVTASGPGEWVGKVARPVTFDACPVPVGQTLWRIARGSGAFSYGGSMDLVTMAPGCRELLKVMRVAATFTIEGNPRSGAVLRACAAGNRGCFSFTHRRGPALPRYVAMGDSYSSGEGAGRYLPAAFGRGAACHRSRRAYSQRLAKRLRGAFRHDPSTDFLACSGDKVPELLQHQVPRLGPDVGLITVGIGGNDAAWTDVLKLCLLEAIAKPVPDCRNIVNAKFAVTLPEMRARLRDAYAQIRSRAPNATVIVAGYPAIFEDGLRSTFCASVGPLIRPIRAVLNQAADRLAGELAAAVREAGFRYVDVRAPFKRHRICGPATDWLHGITLERKRGRRMLETSPSTFHPNAAGQNGYARAIAAGNRDVFR